MSALILALGALALSGCSVLSRGAVPPTYLCLSSMVTYEGEQRLALQCVPMAPEAEAR
jgi:hypothetical protein